MAGQRLLVGVNPAEVMQSAKLTNLKEVRTWLQDLSMEYLERENPEVNSLALCEVSAGDTVYMPLGFMYSERSLNVANISVRFPNFTVTEPGWLGWTSVASHVVLSRP